jgi:transcription-repair coupling factor (superfamily II helicase)
MAALSSSPPEMQVDLQEELLDRYGAIPVETVTLFRVISLKRDLVPLRISKLEQGRDSLVFTFQHDTPVSPEMLMRYLQKYSGRKNKVDPKLTPDSRLIVHARLGSIEQIFDTITATLDEFTLLIQTTA